MRDICAVIKSVVDLIPEDSDETLKLDTLKKNLMHVRYNALYHAPEMMPSDWYDASMLLSKNLPCPPKEEWQKEIHRIGQTKKVIDF